MGTSSATIGRLDAGRFDPRCNAADRYSQELGADFIARSGMADIPGFDYHLPVRGWMAP